MFYLADKNKDTTIFLIVRYRGQRFKFPTGEKVVLNGWNASKHRCKEGRNYPDGSDTNTRLDIWESHVKTVLNDFKNQFKIPTQDEFRAVLKEKAFPIVKKEPLFTDFANRFKAESAKALGTKKAYQTAINWIELYEAENGRLSFNDINADFYNRFHKFVFKNGANSPNFFGTLIKQIKVFMNEAKKEGLHESNLAESFKRVDLDVDNIYLTVDELIKVHRLNITEDFVKSQFEKVKIQHVRLMVKALNLSRARFLIGAFTALRVSDFSRIEELNIKDNFIRIRTEKTGAPVVIPIHWIVKEILETFDLSQKISDQKLNKQIKLVCKYAGIKEPVSLSKFEKGKRIDVVKSKYEWVTTHTARRSGATNMFKAGIPSISIMKITGHRTEKSFLKYIKVTQEENAELLSKHPFFNKT